MNRKHFLLSLPLIGMAVKALSKPEKPREFITGPLYIALHTADPGDLPTQAGPGFYEGGALHINKDGDAVWKEYPRLIAKFKNG
jgi:hypothetical protein